MATLHNNSLHLTYRLLIYLEKSIHENKIETIFIQEPENIPAEKSYFPAFAVIKLNRLMHFTDKTLMNDGQGRI